MTTNATKNTKRTQPRVWVETLWLLASLDATTPLREISLKRGLNLILSEPTEGSPGHGVGKTAFCQLIRFILEDPKWDASTPLREELCSAIPDGAVAARVHLDGEVWTVLKPWKHQKGYRAAKEVDWQQLAGNKVANEHDAYCQALEDTLVGNLPVQTLPASNQSIKWHHLLAWCSRDQGSQYQNYYHWRTDGAGFSLRAQSPALLVKIVLGLLNDTSLHSELRSKELSLESARARITALERRLVDLLAHVKHQLANALGVPDSSPFHKASLFDETSLKGLAEQQIQKCRDDLQRLQERYKDTEQKRLTILEQRAPLFARKKQIENRIGQLQASINGNAEEVERLKKEPEALQKNLSKRCDPGNRLLRECHYVCERIEVVQLSSIRNSKERQKQNESNQSEIDWLAPFLRALNEELFPFDKDIFSLTNFLNEHKNQELAILNKQQQLKEALTAYEQYETLITSQSDWPELKKLRQQEENLEKDVGHIKISIRNQKNQYKARRQAIASLFDTIANQLPRLDWGVFDDENPNPFHMGPVHSTAYSVLETLAGDLACLIDSVNAESFHPGFLLHDSPREAEMSETLFWALIAIARTLDGATCQYVVTTSTKLPAEYKPFVRMQLHSQTDEGYFFRRKVGMESTRPMDFQSRE